MNKDDFIEHGFFSASITATIAAIRNDFKPWFELAEDVSRFGLKQLHEVISPNIKTEQQLIVAAALLRAIQTFQAAMILAERGMQTEAGSLARIVCETAIAVGVGSKDRSFAQRLAADHYRHIQKTANALLADSACGPALSSEQHKAVEEALDEVKQRYGDKPPAKINWEHEAGRCDMRGLYLMVYRLTSGNAVHATANSLEKHVVSDEQGKITSLQFGPQFQGMERTMSAAITSMLHALSMGPALFPVLESDVESLVRRYHNLMEPGRAA